MTPPNPPTRDRAALLPCPWCGKLPALQRSGDGQSWAIFCRNDECGIAPSAAHFRDEASAAVVWNIRAGLCEDCPPVGYPTDKTRCDPCPRRTPTAPGDGLAGAWLPIESAPRDRLIDIWISEDDGSGRRWCDCYYDTICDQWRTMGYSNHIAWVSARFVTHWMPTAEPPRAANLLPLPAPKEPTT